MFRFPKAGLLSLSSLVLILFSFRIFTPTIDLNGILEKLKSYVAYRTQEKIYLHLDKPLYAAGEDIWFSAYLVDATYHRPDSVSKTVYVELFDSNKKLIQQRTLFARDGTTHGDISLSDSLAQGKYLLRAYTNYMKNAGDDFFFKKEIIVLKSRKDTLSSKAPTKEPDSTPELMFFPEGGNLLANVENRIAFKALDRAGRNIAAEGDVLDETGKVMAVFKTEHDGMGLFSLTPGTTSAYHARIKGTQYAFSLPAVMEKGYILRALETRTSIRIIVQSNLDLSQGPGTVFVVAQTRGLVSFTATGRISKTVLIFSIPKNSFQSGVNQITLFDEAGIPRCERLVFVNHQNTLDFTFSPNKPDFQTRNKVELDIHVATKAGTPAKGTFSLSVYDEAKIQDPQEYPESIVNNLLLTSDLKGTIHEPAYYLNDTLPKTKQHLDLLMMTHGWRRFTWATVLQETLSPITFPPEQGIRFSGRLLRVLSKRPAPHSKLKILTSKGELILLETDSLGRFYYDRLLVHDTVELVIQTDNAKGKQAELGFQVDPAIQSPRVLFTTSPFEDIRAESFLAQTEIKNRMKTYTASKDAILLKEIEIKSTRIQEDNSNFKLYQTPDASIKFKDTDAGFPSIFSVLQGRVAGLQVSGSYPNETITIRGTGTTGAGSGSDSSSPLYLLNGISVDANMISSLPVTSIDYVDVLKGNSAAIYGSRGSAGVIAVYTKTGSFEPFPPTGIHHLKYNGFYSAREFYTPRYDASAESSTIPDVRNTLYWNPHVKTSGDGIAHVTFYTSDIKSDYKIVMEGISFNGVPGVGVAKLQVH